MVSGTRIFRSKSTLRECKQGKSVYVAAYFGQKTQIWDEL